MTREIVRDINAQPVENLATNPSFTRAVAGATVVRRNLVSNPAPASVTDYGGVRFAAPTLQAEGHLRYEVNDTNPGANSQRLGIYPNATRGAAVNPGRAYTISFDIRSQYAHQFRLVGLESEGSGFSTNNGAIVNLPAGVWTRMSLTAVAKPSTVRAGFEVGINDTTVREMGEWVDLRRVLIEERPGPSLPYFDGSIMDNTGITYAWEGTPNASPSVARASVVEVYRNYALDPAFESDPTLYRGSTGSDTNSVSVSKSSDYVRGGKHSYRLEKTGTQAYGYVRPVAIQNMSSSLHSTTGNSTIPSGVRRWLGFWAHSSVETVLNVARRGTASFHGGERTIPAGWSYQTISFDGAGESVGWDIGFEAARGTVGAVVHISGITVEDGLQAPSDPLASYFDGYTTRDGDLTPAWTGTPNASASVLYGVQPSALNVSGPTSRAFRSWEGGVEFSTFGGAINNGMNRLGFYGGGTLALGTTYTLLLRLKASAPGPWAFGFDGVGHPIGGEFFVDSSVTEVRRTFLVNNVFSSGFGFLTPRPGTANGTVLTVMRATLVLGDYRGPHIDGDIPGCVWRGTPHASTSIGYPQLVELAAS